jgi:hypothetical protein
MPPRHWLARTPAGTEKKELLKAQPDGLSGCVLWSRERREVLWFYMDWGWHCFSGAQTLITYTQRPWGCILQLMGAALTLLCMVPGGAAQHTHALGAGAGALSGAGTPSRAGPGWQNQNWGPSGVAFFESEGGGHFPAQPSRKKFQMQLRSSNRIILSRSNIWDGQGWRGAPKWVTVSWDPWASSQVEKQEGGLCSWPVATFPTWNPKSEKADLALAQGAATRLERNPKHGPD